MIILSRKKKRRVVSKVLLVLLIVILAAAGFLIYRINENGGGMQGMLATAFGHNAEKLKNHVICIPRQDGKTLTEN